MKLIYEEKNPRFSKAIKAADVWESIVWQYHFDPSRNAEQGILDFIRGNDFLQYLSILKSSCSTAVSIQISEEAMIVDVTGGQSSSVGAALFTFIDAPQIPNKVLKFIFVQGSIPT